MSQGKKHLAIFVVLVLDSVGAELDVKVAEVCGASCINSIVVLHGLKDEVTLI